MLNTETAIAYVEAQFSGSFDTVTGATVAIVDGQTVISVAVAAGDWQGSADVWETENGIYGEL